MKMGTDEMADFLEKVRKKLAEKNATITGSVSWAVPPHLTAAPDTPDAD